MKGKEMEGLRGTRGDGKSKRADVCAGARKWTEGQGR